MSKWPHSLVDAIVKSFLECASNLFFATPKHHGHDKGQLSKLITRLSWNASTGIHLELCSRPSITFILSCNGFSSNCYSYIALHQIHQLVTYLGSDQNQHTLRSIERIEHPTKTPRICYYSMHLSAHGPEVLLVLRHLNFNFFVLSSTEGANFEQKIPSRSKQEPKQTNSRRVDSTRRTQLMTQRRSWFEYFACDTNPLCVNWRLAD